MLLKLDLILFIEEEPILQQCLIPSERIFILVAEDDGETTRVYLSSRDDDEGFLVSHTLSFIHAMMER